MITKQTADYSKLFEKASIALGAENESEYITSLNEYFRNIMDLAAIDLQYTILPLDEETFDINANTREINIPKSFKDGVGVQGDQVAEIIYFTIDRYFDATDLNTQNIYIEWRNANGNEGLSREYVRDLTTLPNKIIFGWPLQSEITEYSGLIEFAVRFYTLKEVDGKNEIVYSFATKPAKIAINKTMDFEITDESIKTYDATEMIVNRFQNSEATDEEFAVPAPTFLLNLTAGDSFDISNTDGYDLLAESYQVRAQAYGTGRVTYYIERSDPDKDEYVGTALEPYYELTTDTVKVDNKIYYEQLIDENTQKVTGYTVYEGDLPVTNNATIYEKYGQYFIDDAGKYRMRAQNRVGANYANAMSEIMVFPAPIAPSIETGTFNILLEEQEDGTSTTTLEPHIIGDLPKGAISYKWTKGNADDAPVLSTSETYTLTNSEGFYYLTLTNTRNTRSKSSSSAVYRVTYPATTPIFDVNISAAAYIGDTLTVAADTSIPHDSFSVVWYEVADVLAGKNPETDIVKHIDANGSGYFTYTPEDDGQFYAALTTVYNTDHSDPAYSNICQVYTRS